MIVERVVKVRVSRRSGSREMKEDREERKRRKAEEKRIRKEERERKKAEKKALKEEKREAARRKREEKASRRGMPAEQEGSAAEEVQGAEQLLDEFSPEKVPREHKAAAVEPEEREATETAAVPREEEEAGWFSRLRQGLSKSRLNFVAPLTRALGARRFDASFWEEVEGILLGADIGVEGTLELVEAVKEEMVRTGVKEPEEVLALFEEVLARALDVGNRELTFSSTGPSVFLVVGVNGTGKTTTIAKLGHLLQREGRRVILAAGDTFRAAGIEQLEEWGRRLGIHTVKHRQGADAAAVVHDAVESARARSVDVVIADTAGRLHTKVNLMEELKKIKRVAQKGAEVTETLLVIDATTGQNGLIQARQFREAVEVTGVVLTKLDGTAKGGIVIPIVRELGIPIKFIGVGEGLEDLHPFDPVEFGRALFSS
jgi:fused signal recognition particle receptor